MWKTLKRVIKPLQSSNMLLLLNQREIICENRDKAEVLNDFFSLQTNIDETNARITEENFENRQKNTIESI